MGGSPAAEPASFPGCHAGDDAFGWAAGPHRPLQAFGPDVAVVADGFGAGDGVVVAAAGEHERGESGAAGGGHPRLVHVHDVAPGVQAASLAAVQAGSMM